MTTIRIAFEKDCHRQSQMLLVSDVMEVILKHYVVSFWETARDTTDGPYKDRNWYRTDRQPNIPHLLTTCQELHDTLIPMLYKEIHFLKSSALHGFAEKPRVTSYKYCRKLWMDGAIEETIEGDLSIKQISALEEKLCHFEDELGLLRPLALDVVVSGKCVMGPTLSICFDVRSLYFSDEECYPPAIVNPLPSGLADKDLLTRRLSSWSIARVRFLFTGGWRLEEVYARTGECAAGIRHLDYDFAEWVSPGPYEPEYWSPGFITDIQEEMDDFGTKLVQYCNDGGTIRIRYLDDPHCFCSPIDDTLHPNVELFACPAGLRPILARKEQKTETWMDKHVLRTERKDEDKEVAGGKSAENVTAVGDAP